MSYFFVPHPQPASSASAACCFFIPGTPSRHHKHQLNCRFSFPGTLSQHRQHQLPADSLFAAPPASIISISCLPFLYAPYPQPASPASDAFWFSVAGTPSQHHQHQLPAISLFPAPLASIISMRCLLLL